MDDNTEKQGIDDALGREFILEYNGTRDYFEGHREEYLKAIKESRFDVVYEFNSFAVPMFVVKYNGNMNEIRDMIAFLEEKSGNVLKLYSNLEKTALGVEK